MAVRDGEVARPRALGSLWFQLQTRFSGCFAGITEKTNCFCGVVNKSTKHHEFDDKVAAVVEEFAERMGRLPCADDKAEILGRFAELHPELLPDEGDRDAKSRFFLSLHKQTGYALFKSGNKRKMKPGQQPRPRRKKRNA